MTLSLIHGVVSSTDRPCDRYACSCELQWYHAGLQVERFHRLGVVWARGGGACSLDYWWRNQSGSACRKCSLLFYSGESGQLYQHRPVSEKKRIQNAKFWHFFHQIIVAHFSGWTGWKWQNTKAAIFPSRLKLAVSSIVTQAHRVGSPSPLTTLWLWRLFLQEWSSTWTTAASNHILCLNSKTLNKKKNMIFCSFRLALVGFLTNLLMATSLNVISSSGILKGFSCKTPTLTSSTMLAFNGQCCSIPPLKHMWTTSPWWQTSWTAQVNLAFLTAAGTSSIHVTPTRIFLWFSVQFRFG